MFTPELSSSAKKFLKKVDKQTASRIVKRIKRKIKCKILFSEKNTPYYRLFKKMKYTEIKIIQGLTPAAVDVMGQRVLIFTHGINPSCLSIKHPEIVQSFTTFFNTLWKQARK